MTKNSYILWCEYELCTHPTSYTAVHTILRVRLLEGNHLYIEVRGNDGDGSIVKKILNPSLKTIREKFFSVAEGREFLFCSGLTIRKRDIVGKRKIKEINFDEAWRIIVDEILHVLAE